MDLSPSDRAAALLLKAARAHGINVARDDVQRALADPDGGTAFVEWANMHLASDHLLTADELALYAALDRSGHVDKLVDAYDLGEVQAVNEDDIKTAIQELNRSTETISKQTETLCQQQDALSRLVRKRGENENQRHDLEASRLRKSESDRKRLGAEVEDMAQSLGYRIADLEQQSKDIRTILNETTDHIFRSDDKLLSSLQKLGWELEQQDPEEQKSIDKLREICMRFIKTTVETLRTRLDRIYLEALVAAERSGESQPTPDQEVKALEEELESLYSEILPVAQMSAEQEFMEPALKSTDSQSGQSLRRSVKAIAYINECLDYLLDRIDLLADRVETLNSHQNATSTVVSTAKTEISIPVSPPRKPAKPAVPVSPVKPSPIRMRANTTSGTRRIGRRRSSGIQDEPAMEALLRNLAITLPPAENATASEQAADLAQTLAERTQKTDDMARNTQETFEKGAVAKLDDVRLAIQLLRDSILAESPFGDVKLVDPEIEGSIHVLAQEVDKVREKLNAVDVKKGAKSVKKEEFVRRWA